MNGGYSPWYWDWWNGGKGTKQRQDPPCEKRMVRKPAKPPNDGKKWVTFVQQECTDPDDPANTAVSDPIEFWVRCENCNCKKRRQCVLKDEIWVRLPNGLYINDVKCVCSDTTGMKGAGKKHRSRK
jgi:hypothetical protein